MGAAPAGRRCLDRLCPVDDCVVDAAPRSRRDRAATCPGHGTQPPARSRRGCSARLVPDRIAGRVPRASSMVDGRCNRKNAIPSAREPPASARLGHRRSGDGEPPARPPRVLSADEWWRRHRHRCGNRRLVARERRLGGGGAVRDRLDRIAGHRSMDEPVAARGGAPTGLGCGHPRFAAGRAPHLALLRDLRDGNRSHASAGQFPGRPKADSRAPDLSHQSRPLPARRGQRPRLRVGGGDLQRFRGHFYNWYDTQNLRPLDPQYVSSVDSGNLAGHLIALANACREWIGRPMAGPELFAGIEDGLNLTRETLHGLPDDRRTQTITRHQLGDALDALAAALRQDRLPPEAIAARLEEFARQAATMVDIARTLANERGDDASAEMLFWAEATLGAIESHRRDVTQSADAAHSLERRLATLEETARAMAGAMEFGFLLDPERKLLSIGYRAAEGILDPSCYDLLASEARLASFMAIAKGEVASRHWFRLGRAVTPIGRGAALVSWSGSMFEYLMPSLVTRAPAGSLLEQTSRLVVRRQITYGAALGVPWGISESAYNVRDLELTRSE